MEEMRKVHESEAKEQLAELIGDVEKGELIAITRDGKDVAALVPFESAERELRRRGVEGFLESRHKWKKAKITTEEMLEYIREGRRL